MGIPEEILKKIDRLEPLPMTVQRLLVALNGAEMDFTEITKTIEFDGAITSNILRTANSAAFGGRGHIDRVRDAVVRLGTITLLDVILMGHFKSLSIEGSHNRHLEDELWLHGATASLSVKAILRETRNRRIPEAATIAALVHDIGKLIMLRQLEADTDAIHSRCRDKGLSVLEAEQELFGCHHAQVGATMAHKWKFPDPIAEAIERHHDPPRADQSPMVDAVILANAVAKVLSAESRPGEARVDAGFNGADVRLGLLPGAFERICDQTSAWILDLKKSYGIPG